MMTTLSLLLNVLVLVPVCLGMATDAPWANAAYGPPSPARAILLAVYAAILITSIGLLVHPFPAAVAALLGVQVIYKLATPLTVGTVTHPVVAANLVIATCHAVTIFTLWRATRGG